jgi:hypothetical protein
MDGIQHPWGCRQTTSFIDYSIEAGILLGPMGVYAKTQEPVFQRQAHAGFVLFTITLQLARAA